MSTGKLAVVRIDETPSNPAAYCIEVTFDADRLPLTIVEGDGRIITPELKSACDTLIALALDEDI